MSSNFQNKKRWRIFSNVICVQTHEIKMKLEEMQPCNKGDDWQAELDLKHFCAHPLILCRSDEGQRQYIESMGIILIIITKTLVDN